MITTNPRVIADDVWAKLLWAGLNLTQADLPANASGSYYPMEMIRAITLTWMFSYLTDLIPRIEEASVSLNRLAA